MKLGLSFELFIIKSPTSVLGLIPLNVVSILFKGKSSIVLLPFSIISSIPSLEVVTYSSDFALGPSKRLPSTVGVTNIPLLFLLGTWNRVFLQIPPATLSNKQYSPFKGFISYFSSFIRLFIKAPYKPAAFIIILVFIISLFSNNKINPSSSSVASS